jgi:predicted HAD superfamily Cof-like phosphohydrolase
MTNHFQDLKDFHKKFNMPLNKQPTMLKPSLLNFRLKFLLEELEETELAAYEGDIAGVADGLVDLVYVAIGMAELMGLPWDDLWAEVQKANMSKERAENENQGHREQWQFDIIKPEGWTAPKIQEILNQAKDKTHER